MLRPKFWCGLLSLLAPLLGRFERLTGRWGSLLPGQRARWQPPALTAVQKRRLHQRIAARLKEHARP
jgi:hypothetical protein